jgi:hypothetical protein
MITAILVNNAGEIMVSPFENLETGFRTWDGCNVLGHTLCHARSTTVDENAGPRPDRERYVHRRPGERVAPVELELCQSRCCGL